MTILAVDDEPLVLELVKSTLKLMGHADVTLAGSATEVLDIVAQGKLEISTFLLDIKMPGMDGIELCRALRQMPAHRNTPIIMLTAMTEKHFVDDSFLAGATDYVNKPIEATELGARMRVAQMIYNEQRRLNEASQVARELKVQVEARFQFDLEDAVTLEDLPRFIGVQAMENYLYRLGRLRQSQISAVGFQIAHVARLYGNCSGADFHFLLTDVGEAIFEGLRTTESIISYFGTGTFVAIIPRAATIDTDEVSARIAQVIDEFGIATSDEVPLDVQVVVTEPINGSIFATDPKAVANLAALRAREIGLKLPQGRLPADMARAG